MKPHILFIKGASVDLAYAAQEQEYFLESVQSLRASGARVTTIGNARDGFSWALLSSQLRRYNNASAIIIDAHGNISDDRHFMRISRSRRIWAEDFYKAVKQAFVRKPANIFMFSCGSGNGLKQAQKLLPPRSTIFSLVVPDGVDSYCLKPDSFSISGRNVISNPIEGLFLNLMCIGLPNKWSCDPHLTVTSGKMDKGSIIELWTKATSFCCEWSGDSFPEQYINEAKALLSPYLPEDKMNTALETMEYYKQEVEATLPSFNPNSSVPFRAHYTLDTEDFKSEVVHHELLGPIGAMAYGIFRDDLGAFQRPIIKPTLDANKL